MLLLRPNIFCAFCGIRCDFTDSEGKRMIPTLPNGTTTICDVCYCSNCNAPKSGTGATRVCNNCEST